MSDVRILATGLRFPEGPVALQDGSVLVAEIAGRTMVRVAPDGAKSVAVKTEGGPNGAAFGPGGLLFICDNGGNKYHEGDFRSHGPSADYAGGSIQTIDLATGATKALYTHCGSDRLSSPNDLVFDAHGGFYFTDMGKRLARSRDYGGIYYAMADGSKIVEVAYPVMAANGIGLSPDGRTVYVAETETARLYGFDIIEPGVVKKLPYPAAAHGGRLLCGLGGLQHFDSLAVTQSGNICVGTLVSGNITVVSPGGEVLRQVKVPDTFPTNICFGGPDMKTAYITLSEAGHLGVMDWDEPGLRLHHAV